MDETSSSRQRNTASVRQAQWRAVTELFDQCLGASPEQREQLLAAESEEIASEVRSLLLNSGSDEESFLSPVDQILNPPPSLPQQIGAYRIERLLGQGGMGSVFLAHRVGEFDQMVAVKLIRQDFGSAGQALDRRFRQERQILASLQHPNIAHLIDGGTSGAHPYLVVEYVPGVRIDDYCNNNRLSLRQRIELFLKVCRAVQYAHQNLVVHRDLKPANVLVLDDGTPKLLDFGIARLLHSDDSVPDLTRTAMRMFTPSYASPEQLRGEPAGTASDVYSLGVMLYEVLTGQKPHVVDTDSDIAVIEAVCRQTPTLASAAIKRHAEELKEAKAAERTTAYATWSRTLRGDLDLILARAISAEIPRRYQSVEQLTTDLTRYLARLPILARKDTWTYRTQKFWSRHKALVSVASLAFLILLVAGFVLWREYRIAIQQRERAERRFSDLRALARSNITEVQDALDQVQGGTAVRTLILSRALQYIDSLAAEKDNDIDLQRDLASAYLMLAKRLGHPGTENLGDTAGAIANYDRSCRILEGIVALPQATERDHVTLIFAHFELAALQGMGGKLEAAKQALAQAASESDAILAKNPKDLLLAYHMVNLTHRELSALLVDDSGPNLSDPVQALRHADISLQAEEAAYKIRPDNWTDIELLISVKSKKADALVAAGSEDEAMNLRKSVLDFVKGSKVKPPSNGNLSVIYATYQYAMRLATKDPRGALPLAESALATIENARASDPGDQALVIWHARALTTVGNVYRLAGQREKGLKMIVVGMKEITSLLSKNPALRGDLYYGLAEGHRALAEDATQKGNPRKALAEYQSVERIYSEDAARIPDDLDVYRKRAENQLTVAAVESKLGMVKQSSASRLLAIECVNRVLQAHPDNQVAAKLKLKAAATRY